MSWAELAHEFDRNNKKSQPIKTILKTEIFIAFNKNKPYSNVCCNEIFISNCTPPTIRSNQSIKIGLATIFYSV